MCAVPDEYIETYGAQSMMEQAGIWDIAQDHLTGASDEVMLKALRAMEDPGIAGEMFSSGGKSIYIYIPQTSFSLVTFHVYLFTYLFICLFVYLFIC